MPMVRPTLANRRDRLNGPAVPVFLLMTDQDRLPDPGPATAALPAGSGVILRHRDDGGRRALMDRLEDRRTRRHLVFLVANDWRRALAPAGPGPRLGGLHLSEAALRHGPGTWRRVRRRPGFLVTAAAHGPRGLQAARHAGVDAVLLAPVMPTASHPEASHLGLLRFARLVRSAGVPVYALGGVGLAMAGRLARAGAAGMAGIGLFTAAGGRDLDRARTAFSRRRKSCMNPVSGGNDRADHLGKS